MLWQSATALLALAIPATAGATISSVFGTVTCTEQTVGQQRVSAGAETRPERPSPWWDGTPIDVSVGFPAATGEDNNYPVVGHLPRLGRHARSRRRAHPRSAG